MTRRAIANAKSLGARSESSEIEGARRLVTSLLQEAIEWREVDLEVLRKLLSQANTTSAFLIERFAIEADECEHSDLAREFVSEEFGYVDETGKVKPRHGRDTIRLDAFLHHYITDAQWRRRQNRERGRRSGDEGYAA